MSEFATIRETVNNRDIRNEVAGTLTARPWTDILDDVRKEEEDFAAQRTNERPIRDMLKTIAFQLRMRYRDVNGTIQGYCIRNNVDEHESKINEFILNQAWTSLANTILQDKTHLE